MGRAPCCDKANVKKGPWAPEEDSKLKAYIEQHGTGGNWIALPQKVGLKRCGKSCRLRWLNYLRPNIRHGGFTEEEENIICSLYISIGSRWSIIAAQLPGRTDNDIKNYWNTKLRKKLFGKRKDQQNRRLAPSNSKQAEALGIKRAGPSEENESTNTCWAQPRGGIDLDHHFNMDGPYDNIGPVIIPQLFEKTSSTEASSITDISPCSQIARFQLCHEQAFDQGMFVPEHITTFTNLMERVESTSIDRLKSMDIGTAEMQASNCLNRNRNASQIPHSTLRNAVQVSYETSGTPPLEYAKFIENLVKLERPSLVPSETLSQNNNSLVFPQSSVSCGSLRGIYQSSLTNVLNAENNNNVSWGGYEFSMDMNDLLYYTNNSGRSPVLHQMESGNYSCGPSDAAMDMPGWTVDIKSSSSSCQSFYL